MIDFYRLVTPCCYEQDTGHDFEGWDSGNNYRNEPRTGMSVDENLWRNWSTSFTSPLKRLSETRFPKNTCMEGQKKLLKDCYRPEFVMTVLSAHVSGTRLLPCAVVFIATLWWYMDVLSRALSCNGDLWFLGDRPIYLYQREFQPGEPVSLERSDSDEEQQELLNSGPQQQQQQQLSC